MDFMERRGFAVAGYIIGIALFFTITGMGIREVRRVIDQRKHSVTSCLGLSTRECLRATRNPDQQAEAKDLRSARRTIEEGIAKRRQAQIQNGRNRVRARRNFHGARRRTRTQAPMPTHSPPPPETAPTSPNRPTPPAIPPVQTVPPPPPPVKPPVPKAPKTTKTVPPVTTPAVPPVTTPGVGPVPPVTTPTVPPVTTPTVPVPPSALPDQDEDGSGRGGGKDPPEDVDFHVSGLIVF